MPRFDPVASLRCWAVEVDFAGGVLRIPPLPASEWLICLTGLNVLSLLDLVEDRDDADWLLSSGVAWELPDLERALGELLVAAAGRSVDATLVLASVAREHWHLVGADLARMGVRFDQVPLGAALDAIYASMCRMLDEKSLPRFNELLERPLGAPDIMLDPRVRARAAKPLPATAEQYVRVRPRTRLRRPQDRLDAPSVGPTAPPAPPGDSDPVPTSDGPRDAGSPVVGESSPPAPTAPPPPAG